MLQGTRMQAMHALGCAGSCCPYCACCCCGAGLCSGHNGDLDIKKHPFFKTINWAKLERREVESKFKPEVSSATDIKNFDKLWTDQPAVDSPCGTPNCTNLPTGTPTNSNTRDDPFKGFTYVAPSFLNGELSSAMNGIALTTQGSNGDTVISSCTATPLVRSGSSLAPNTQRVLGFNVSASTAKAGGA